MITIKATAAEAQCWSCPAEERAPADGRLYFMITITDPSSEDQRGVVIPICDVCLRELTRQADHALGIDRLNLWQSGNGRITLILSDSEARTGHHQGQCDEDIAHLVALPHIAAQFERITHADLKRELRETGAWSEKELRNRSACRQRLLWLACGDVVAGQCTPFHAE